MFDLSKSKFFSSGSIDIIKRFSGPKGNFYRDTGIYSDREALLKEDIINNLDQDGKSNISSIEIMYSDGNTIKL